MYNRYIPQRDGTMRRIPADKSPHSHSKESGCPASPASVPGTFGQSGSQIPDNEPLRPRPVYSAPDFHPDKSPDPSRRPAQSAGGFFRQLLPRELDAEDLLIVALLLLMHRGREDQGLPLLTLALYLIL